MSLEQLRNEMKKERMRGFRKDTGADDPKINVDFNRKEFPYDIGSKLIKSSDLAADITERLKLIFKDYKGTAITRDTNTGFPVVKMYFSYNPNGDADKLTGIEEINCHKSFNGASAAATRALNEARTVIGRSLKLTKEAKFVLSKFIRYDKKHYSWKSIGWKNLTCEVIDGDPSYRNSNVLLCVAGFDLGLILSTMIYNDKKYIEANEEGNPETHNTEFTVTITQPIGISINPNMPPRNFILKIDQLDIDQVKKLSRQLDYGVMGNRILMY